MNFSLSPSDTWLQGQVRELRLANTRTSSSEPLTDLSRRDSRERATISSPFESAFRKSSATRLCKADSRSCCRNAHHEATHSPKASSSQQLSARAMLGTKSSRNGRKPKQLQIHFVRFGQGTTARLVMSSEEQASTRKRALRPRAPRLCQIDGRELGAETWQYVDCYASRDTRPSRPSRPPFSGGSAAVTEDSINCRPQSAGLGLYRSDDDGLL